MKKSARWWTRTVRQVVLILAIFALVGLPGVLAQSGDAAVRFRFGYRPGEQYRIVGVNRQQLFVDGERRGEAEILTRVRVLVDQAASRGGREGADLSAEYQVSEEAETTGEPFSVDRSYGVDLWQDLRGRQEVPRGSFVPQVRNVPVFPEDPVEPGDSWTAPAVEVYDFRDGMGIQDPVVVPVEVSYEYLGPRDFEGRSYDAIAIRYALFHRPAPDRPEAEFIRLMTARFSQELLWDRRAGRAHYYEERYNFFMQTRDGARLEYRGTADGRVVEAPPLDRDTVQREIEDSIAADAIADTTVRSDEDGVTIALENIQFAPDSAELRESEIPKLEWLAGVLRRYPDRDIMISGHTALAGTAAGRQRLSEERAAAVGEWLIGQAVRERSELMYRGLGARDPVADNSTAEGRRRNRRVEITILEN